MDDIEYSSKIISLPISKEAHSITLPANSQLAGIRFHPGVDTANFGDIYDKPFTVKNCTGIQELQAIVGRIMNISEHYARISTNG